MRFLFRLMLGSLTAGVLTCAAEGAPFACVPGVDSTDVSVVERV